MAVTPDTAERLIHDLVAIPSVSTYEHSAVSHLVTWMQQSGYDEVGSSRVDLQACKLEYSIVSPK